MAEKKRKEKSALNDSKKKKKRVSGKVKITERDRQIFLRLYDTRALNIQQLTSLFFPSEIRAIQRLKLLEMNGYITKQVIAESNKNGRGSKRLYTAVMIAGKGITEIQDQLLKRTDRYGQPMVLRDAYNTQLHNQRVIKKQVHANELAVGLEVFQKTNGRKEIWKWIESRLAKAENDLTRRATFVSLIRKTDGTDEYPVYVANMEYILSDPGTNRNMTTRIDRTPEEDVNLYLDRLYREIDRFSNLQNNIVVIEDEYYPLFMETLVRRKPHNTEYKVRVSGAKEGEHHSKTETMMVYKTTGNELKLIPCSKFEPLIYYYTSDHDQIYEDLKAVSDNFQLAKKLARSEFRESNTLYSDYEDDYCNYVHFMDRDFAKIHEVRNHIHDDNRWKKPVVIVAEVEMHDTLRSFLGINEDKKYKERVLLVASKIPDSVMAESTETRVPAKNETDNKKLPNEILTFSTSDQTIIDMYNTIPRGQKSALIERVLKESYVYKYFRDSGLLSPDYIKATTNDSEGEPS